MYVSRNQFSSSKIRTFGGMSHADRFLNEGTAKVGSGINPSGGAMGGRVAKVVSSTANVIAA
jgi:hypothetical protein